MKRYLLLFFLIILNLSSFSQKLSVGGNLQDTIAKSPLSNAVVMAVKLMDSTLVNYTRSDENGFFKLQSLPIDTYQVIISHPKFSDQVYFIFGDNQNLTYDFGKIILQPKNIALDEVTIFAFKDPVYYKGDTLIYTADSFKTKANATVEDLLKKLPGLKVDADGKITSQGKKVDKVLVDGDEFFGSDPTIATKNLNASAIESVQVYEKKNDDAANNSTGEETQKILNLKLKDEAKKGYFGKISGASDFQKFHEGELLGNYFKKKLKISVFGLGSNTPNSGFGWEDSYKYGLSNEFVTYGGDEDGMNFMYTDNGNQGIPQTIKTGFYFTNQISKKTKLNVNYTFNQSEVLSTTSTNSQYFLTDTSYTTSEQAKNLQKNKSHLINFGVVQKIDSLTEFTLNSKVKVINTKSNNNKITDFIRSDNVESRKTDVLNNNQSNGYDLSNNFKLTKKFKKKDRLLNLTYSNAISESTSDGLLVTDNTFYNDSLSSINSINQKKDSYVANQNHNAGIVYQEPLTKKIKIEGSYDFMYYKTSQNKKSVNAIGGEYNILDSALTNNFLNRKTINRVGLKFIYESKKTRYTIGARARNIFVDNNNLFTRQNITQNFNNILPFTTLRYKFSDNMSLNVGYYTSSTNPSITQLQPVPDNTNPNFVNIGNPNLLPTFGHHVDLNFNSWKSVSGKYFWMGASFVQTNNDITTSTYYDSIGRTISKPINVNGNYFANGYIGYNMPFFSKKLSLQPNMDGSYSSNKNYINNIEVITKNIRSNFGLEIMLNFDKIEAGVTGYMEFNSSSATLNTQSNKPYTAQGLSGRFSAKLPWKFLLESNANYTINSKRSNGYNINFLVWNASLSKTLLKNENLILSAHAYDILNQNISIGRNVSTNVITDTKTNIITQYFLLKATFKFNSNKTKEEEDDF